jgi:uncharacterized protein YbaP (TraB family)
VKLQVSQSWVKTVNLKKPYCMPANKIKEELAKLIAETDNEDLLSMVKEDLVFYKKSRTTDITDSLSDEQLKELEKLATEPDEKDTQSLEEFNKATEKWRTK